MKRYIYIYIYIWDLRVCFPHELSNTDPAWSMGFMVILAAIHVACCVAKKYQGHYGQDGGLKWVK